MIAKPGAPRKLLTRTVRLATLVVVGVAETACNLQVSRFDRPDVGNDAGSDAGRDAGASPAIDADVDGSTP